MSDHQMEAGERGRTFTDDPGDNEDGIPQTSGNGNYNPMLNPVVLERFLTICDLGDLKRFRLVCTLWNEISLPRWRNQMTVVIEGNQTDWSDVKKLNWNKMEQIVPSLEIMPYRSYGFNGWNFSKTLQHSRHPHQVNVETFFVSYGSWMQEITFDVPEIEYGIALKRVIFELTPNLKLLALNGVESKSVLKSLGYGGYMDGEEEEESGDYDAVEEVEVSMVTPQLNMKILKVSLESRIARNSDWVPISWGAYFRHFPNMESLELGKLREDHVEEIAGALATNRECGKKIKKMDLQNSKVFVSDIRRILSIPHLQLEELHVQIRLEEHLDSSDEEDLTLLHNYPKLREDCPELVYPSPPDPELHSFIQEQAHILHTLHLRTNDLNDSSWQRVRFTDFRFQTSLEFLTKLVLRGNISNNWNFLQYTPNLKVLHIYKFNLKNMFKEKSYKEVKDMHVRLDCIEELRIASKPGMYENASLVEIPPHTLKFLAKCMPNLKVLEAPLTNESFRVVCVSWNGLRELYASNSENLDDEGITGMVVGCQIRLPNITHLKYLEVFSTSAELLTYTSVIHGFLQLPLLRTVDVWSSNKISNAAKIAMDRRFSGY